jgi:hypothetical protein
MKHHLTLERRSSIPKIVWYQETFPARESHKSEEHGKPVVVFGTGCRKFGLNGVLIDFVLVLVAVKMSRSMNKESQSNHSHQQP